MPAGTFSGASSGTHSLKLLISSAKVLNGSLSSESALSWDWCEILAALEQLFMAPGNFVQGCKMHIHRYKDADFKDWCIVLNCSYLRLYSFWSAMSFESSYSTWFMGCILDVVLLGGRNTKLIALWSFTCGWVGELSTISTIFLPSLSNLLSSSLIHP